MPNSTNQRFTLLRIESAGQQPLETVSNSLADTVLIKTVSGNGDLESSQRRIGRPGATGAVSVVARYLCFLTEIFRAGVAEAEKAQNARVETKKRRASISRRPALTFWRFFRRKKRLLRLDSNQRPGD